VTDDSRDRGNPGQEERRAGSVAGAEEALRARLERLRAAAAQHRAQQEAADSLASSPDGTPELEDYPYAPRAGRPPLPEDSPQPSLFHRPARPMQPQPPSYYQADGRMEVSSAEPDLPHPDSQYDPVLDAVEEAPSAPPLPEPAAPAIRRVALLSEARAREEERDRLEAERRAQDRRLTERRSEAAFRNDPPPRTAPAGQMPGPRLIAENEGLIARNLGKQYKKRPVLRDVSLAVQRGEAVGLLGPNGAGKTTSFYIMIGLIAADYGEILLDGQDVTSLPMYRRARMGVGYLPQEASIFRGLTVEQNIRAILEAAEPERDQREAMLEDLMAEFSITHLRRTPAIALSGGERRRLEIARALATRPHFILLDEPLAGIDPIAVRDIRDLVKHLKDRGLGVLITDHNVRETLDIVDRAYILHDGRVLMEGKPAEIVSDSEVRRVYLGDRFSL